MGLTGRIRFTWEQREFEKSFSLLQNNTLSRAELSESSGVAANIHYGDVLIKFGEYLDMSQESFPWIKKKAYADKFRTSFLQDGDVVFADTAEDETAGKCCEIRNCESMAIISGLHTIPCRPVSKFAPGYLGYCLNSAAFHEQLVPLMQGTKVVSISKAALKSTLIQYPSDDKEQQKIGALFRGIDRLITLHQRKHEKLGSIKKALLEKMFPKNGTKFPEIRFSGFTDAWEQRKLASETTEIIAGGDVEKTILKEKGNFPVIANALTNDGVVGYYEYSFRVKAPAVTVTGRGDVGHAKARVVDFTPVVRLLSLKSRHDVFFMENAINNMRIVIESTGVPQLTVPQLSQYEIFYPQTILEEKKIGQFFRALDQLITLHQRELEKLRNIKKACLEKMFV